MDPGCAYYALALYRNLPDGTVASRAVSLQKDFHHHPANSGDYQLRKEPSAYVELQLHPSPDPVADSPPLVGDPAISSSEALPSQPLIVRFSDVGKLSPLRPSAVLLRNLLLRPDGSRPKPREFWPIRHVSFDIRRGTVGVIGQNGIRKKHTAASDGGRVYPSEGVISVRSRRSALGARRGLSSRHDRTRASRSTAPRWTDPRRIRDRMDQILHFAELVDFLDTPVRYYSSGMLARLGFSVAVHTDPDLLLSSMKCCPSEITRFSRSVWRGFKTSGRAERRSCFVSHDAHTVRQICDRVLWLRDGKLLRDGDPTIVLDEYIAAIG